MPHDPILSPTANTQHHRWLPRLLKAGRIIISVIILFVTGLIALPESPVQGNAPGGVTRTAPSEVGPVLKSTQTPSPPTYTPAVPISSPQDAAHIPHNLSSPIQSPLNQGMLILSISEGGYSHLFAYQPLRMPFIRLTNGAWDDITPALSPDGKYLAYASNRSGYWDLYLMDLASGGNTRLTDTPAYDASPSWSPDGQYLVYESYTENLKCF
jgi:TolB protein